MAYVLRANLRGVAAIRVGDANAFSLPNGRPDSIDSLGCRLAPADYRLEISVVANGRSRAQARLLLVDNFTGDSVEQWQWQGSLSAAERQYLNSTPAVTAARGDLAAPWQREDITAAASALSRDFVCAMRPHTRDVTTVHWSIDPGLPPAIADTFRAAQHYVSAYRELDTTASSAMYQVQARATPLHGGVWQLWLVATPGEPGHTGVQAVTYMRDAEPAAQAPLRRPVTARANVAVAPVAPADAHKALAVELLGVSKSERGATADLGLRLRVRNQADRPLAYSLKSSGGYFEQCIGSQTYYRHQVYGSVSGVLAAGESKTELLRIEGVRHQPGATRGASACAAVGDLSAFQDFARHGYRVTDYLRWEI
jgi:hypothetical protein